MTQSLISWRPFTHTHLATPPLEIVAAKESLLFDSNGRAYIDAISSWWVITHGHCHPFIAQAVSDTARSLDQIVFANFTHAPAQTLLQKLRTLLPKEFAAAFFSDNGSTSVEVALKMAFHYWRLNGQPHKNKIVSFVGAYHGDTAGCMSVSQRGLFTEPYKAMLFDVVQFSDAIASFTDDTAAIIIEPLVQGAGGMIMWDQAFLVEVLTIARKKNIVIIFDEVMTGFYRTGARFAFEALGFLPDIICLSKGLTGGMLPLSLTICQDHIYESFTRDDKTSMFFHGHTFTANPLSCAAAAANLELMNSALEQKIASIEHHHRLRIDALHSSLIKNKRMRGTIAAVELYGLEGYLGEHSSFITQIALHHGVFLRPIGNVLYLMPPYCITESELMRVWDVVEIILCDLEKKC